MTRLLFLLLFVLVDSKRPKVKGVINRQLYRDLFVDHSNISMVLHPDGTTIRAIQNERHKLDCKTLECAAVFLKKIDPVAMEIVLESRAVNHIGEIATLCDAIDVLESLEYISLRLSELNNNSTNSLAVQLMYCLPDKIVEFRGFLPEIVAYFAQRKPLALFFVPWNQKPFDLAKLLQINAQRIVFDQQFDLTAFDLETSTSLIRPNPVIRLLECDVKIAPFYITADGNQTDVDLDQVVKTLAMISVLSPRPFLKLTTTQMQIVIKNKMEPPEVIEMLQEIVSDANHVLNEMAKLGVPLKLLHLTPLLSLDSMLISNSAWMDELVAILIERFDLADYSMEGKTCQLRGQVRDLLLTITITELHHHRDPDGTNRKIAKELVRKLQSTCENE